MVRFGKVVRVDEAAAALGLSKEEVLKRLKAGKLRGRCLSADEFEIEEHVIRAAAAKRTVSEILFADYLEEQGLGPADYEPDSPDKLRRVDYRLRHQETAYWFEVKEFDEDPSLLDGAGFRSYDPYEFVRRKINDASKNFRDYKGERCSLVLYNDQLNLAEVRSAEILLSGMLGNLSYSFPVNVDEGKIDGEAVLTFGAGGKMVNRRTGKTSNTRIGAVIGLEVLPVGKRRFRIELERQKQALGRRFNDEERVQLLQTLPEAYSESVLRAVVCENPHATWRLPAELFVGPYDERWGLVGDGSAITRLYAGSRLEALLDEEHELELDRSPLVRKGFCGE